MCMTFLEFRHIEMTAAQRGQKGLRQWRQTSGLKSPQDSDQEKKKKKEAGGENKEAESCSNAA